MSSTVKLIIFLLGISFVITVFYLLVRHKINERNSLLWLAGSLVILVLATIPNLLDIVAQWLGVSYPPTLLFLLSILVILLIILYQSIQISALQARCRELTQYLAIIESRQERGEQNTWK